jgi:hypothetical protein
MRRSSAAVRATSLADAERLREVIVGAALEPEHRVRFRVARRDHQDGGVRVDALISNGAADRNAVQTREHHIEQDEIELLGARPFEPERAGAALHDVEAGQAQVQPHELPDRRLVFDDEHTTPQRPRAGFSHVDLSPLWDTLTLGQDSN